MTAAWALATKVTTAATSSGFSKRFRSELGRTFSKNSFSTCAVVTTCWRAASCKMLPAR